MLLKNTGIFPVDKKKKIALIGPCADSKDLLGPWQFSQFTEETITLREGLEKTGYDVIYSKGCNIETPIENGIEKAVLAAEEADIILLAVGESSSMSGEAASRLDIGIPACQMKLARALKQTGKPLAVTLTNGRPLLLNWFEQHADAILETWFLGSVAGDAIAAVVSGTVSPSGKLTMSFPAHMGQIPVYYNHLNTGRPFVNDGNRFTSRYIDGPNEPLYPFGFGLTYGTVEMSNFVLDKASFSGDDCINASIWLKNTGQTEITEVVQLYIRDRQASVVRPIKELKGFQRVTMQRGEERKVVFSITEEMLKFYNSREEYTAEKGKFDIWVGTSSREQDLRKRQFEYE